MNYCMKCEISVRGSRCPKCGQTRSVVGSPVSLDDVDEDDDVEDQPINRQGSLSGLFLWGGLLMMLLCGVAFLVSCLGSIGASMEGKEQLAKETADFAAKSLVWGVIGGVIFGFGLFGKILKRFLQSMGGGQ